ncbi:MAG: phage tail assembly chaperone [Roseibium sp.]
MLPWAHLIRLAASQLSWKPSDFWTATPKELSAALGRSFVVDAPERARLDVLLKQFPDQH